MMNKLLSIVIPMYNSAQWLEKCLLSVLNQDLSETQMEIICVNDGSPDNSAELAKKIGESHPCIIVLNQENQGPSGARNNGMRHATGKYLMFVDPDDYVEPNVFGALVNQMEEEQLDMLRFNYQMVDEHDNILRKPKFEQEFDYSPQFMTGVDFLANRLDLACNIWRYIYRKDIITVNNIWCYTGDYYDDTPWLPLVLMKAERMNVCDRVVYDYLERQDGLVRASTPPMINRRIDGAFLLLSLLKDEKKQINRLLADTAIEKTQGVIKWYRYMETCIVVSVLTTIAVYHFAQRKADVSRLYQANVLPLYMRRSRLVTKVKILLINISPMLFVHIVHLKNK